ncbi:Receptor-type guanylate cyclase gcy [Seminavis robusta]|uniref:guanylate cyclase n=1 Tax=Seminavis robusta TaxID=568900 RepID=A0A9N8HDL4_9STRA|nr:Receptor-type guanylate cyclase gcy [Seminavis robusta]|eukprot:Sro366_g127640.1 Receptor-type guanylate cyclase gcy (1158) ;mRNA; f:54876-58982
MSHKTSSKDSASSRWCDDGSESSHDSIALSDNGTQQRQRSESASLARTTSGAILHVALLLLLGQIIPLANAATPVSAGTAAITSYKDVYTVGVLANRGIETAYNDFNTTFHSYLTATAGQALGGVRFEMRPVKFKTIFQDALTVDFVYSNPSAYSCIESEFGAQPLASQVSRRKIGGHVYDLPMFGGLILVRADNDQINSITDLRDKIVACISVNGLGAAQMQFREMELAGLNQFTDLKQLVFTSNQGKIVNGVLSGQFDVGFVRTDQVERTKDADGNLVDPALFKIIDPKANLTIDGVPFPFEASTPLYPEWNFAANAHVPPSVSEQVQRAMLEMDDHASHYQKWIDCGDNNSTADDCYSQLKLEMKSTTWDEFLENVNLGELATEAMERGRFAKWRTTLSYMQLRSMQEATGFIGLDPETNKWRCVRTTELYDAVTCPKGYDKKSKELVEQGCQLEGLSCDDEYNCLCSPCEKPLVCENNFVKWGNQCVSIGWVVAMVLAPIILLIIVAVKWYVNEKRRAADSVWTVEAKELQFGHPPVVLGEGSFGRVLLADYRGTKVAVKRIGGKKRAASTSTDNMSDVTSGNGSHGAVEIPYGAESCTTDVKESFLQEYNDTPRDVVVKDHDMASIDSSDQDRVIVSRQNRQSTRWSPAAHFGSHGMATSTVRADFVREMRLLSKLRHPCITTVMGAVISPFDDPMLIMEWMANGSLYDVLRSETVNLESHHYHSIIIDIIQGIRYLHSASPQIVHGDLKSKNVLISSTFRVSICDFGLSHKAKNSIVGTKFCLAPELLRGDSCNTAASDVFSFAVVLNEIYSEKDPYEGETLEEQELLGMIANPAINKRPRIVSTCPKEAVKLIKQCWAADPAGRPTAEDIDLHVKLLDSTEFAPIGHKTKKQVLYDVFPRHIADALSKGKPVEPEWHESIAIFFSDIRGFTTIASTFSPIKVSSLLDRLYKAFDDLSIKHDIFKIETTGDAYMAVSNLVKDQADDYVRRVAAFALDAVEAANRTLVDLDDPSRGYVNIRVGFHVGSVVSNVVGNLNPKYGIFGDAVNTSARMESTSEAGRVQCSEPAAELLRKQAPSSFTLTPRGTIDVKGKGTMTTYWISHIDADRGAPLAEQAPEIPAPLNGMNFTKPLGSMNYPTTPDNLEDDGLSV